MGEYLVSRRYQADRLGPWAEGDIVELDDETAAQVERDSEGVLLTLEAGGDAGEARRQSPRKDRASKGKRNRAVDVGDSDEASTDDVVVSDDAALD